MKVEADEKEACTVGVARTDKPSYGHVSIDLVYPIEGVGDVSRVVGG